MNNFTQTLIKRALQPFVFGVYFALFWVLFVGESLLYAQHSLRVGGGLSTPYNQINAVFATDKFTTPSGAVRHLVNQAETVGWHTGLRYMAALGEDAGFTIAANYHNFSAGNIAILDQMNTAVGTAQISQTLIPIAGGIEYRFLRLLFLSGYLTGELSYNLFSSRAEMLSSVSTLTLPAVQTDFNRIGGNVGVGADIMLGTFGVDVCLRYNWANLIGRASAEQEKTFVSLNVSLVFGKKF